MTSETIPLLLLTVGAFVYMVVIVRRLLRKPPPAKEFRRLFENAWLAAAVMAMGAVWLVLRMAFGLNQDAVYIFVGIGGFGVALLLLASYPASWLAARVYRQWRSEPDFAEDTRGNSVPDPDAHKD